MVPGMKKFLTNFIGEETVQRKDDDDEVSMVFVYGTLKRSFGNHRTMMKANGRFVGEHTTDPSFTMVSLQSYPAVIEGGNTSIVGEVFEVDTIYPLDVLEGFPSFYNRVLIDTPYGPAWMYVLARAHENIKHYTRVVDGVWR